MSGMLLSGCGFVLPPQEQCTSVLCCPSPTTSQQMQKGPASVTATNFLLVWLSSALAPTAACGPRCWLHCIAWSSVTLSYATH